MKFNYKHPIFEDYDKQLNEFVEKFRNLIKEGDWVIDIGASSGDSTIAMGYLAGPTGKVIVFEPSPVIDKLKENINNNLHLSNFEVYNVGMLDLDCEKYFYVTPSLDNGGIIDDNLFKDEGRAPNCKCKFVNGESFLKNQYKEDISKILFIKIDAKGVDYIILKNLLAITKEYKPVYFVEWWNNQKISNFLFDIIDEMNYTPLRDDNFLKTNREDFHNKSQNLILIPNI